MQLIIRNIDNSERSCAPYTQFPPAVTSCTLEYSITNSVTESKLILLASWQASKSRDEWLEQGIATLWRKAADREDRDCNF